MNVPLSQHRPAFAKNKFTEFIASCNREGDLVCRLDVQWTVIVMYPRYDNSAANTHASEHQQFVSSNPALQLGKSITSTKKRRISTKKRQESHAHTHTHESQIYTYTQSPLLERPFTAARMPLGALS